MHLRVALLAALTATASLAQTFTVAPIRAHMRFLASDSLEGRGTGTRGHRIAAEYVASQFEAMGAEPGANGSYFQDVPFLKTIAADESTLTLTPTGGAPVTLHYAQGFMSAGDPLRRETQLTGDVVYAGFGVTAPDQKYDNYAKLDTRGKIVAIFSGAPKSFPNEVRAHYSSSLNKAETAARHGAIGLITLTSPKDAAHYDWGRVVRQYRLGAMNWIEANGTPHGVAPSLSATLSLSDPSTAAFLTAAKLNPEDIYAAREEGKPRPMALPMRASAHLLTAREKVVSPNVVAIIRGTDPQLRNEYVVYSSHLDHLGITEPVNGDAINNGALDNASGIAATLEIARAFAADRPRRSILFVATTGEEKGLRGADYFANNPTVPLKSIVADINIDEILMLHKTRDLTPLGLDNSDLGDYAKKIAKAMNVELSPDPFPEEVIFVRSDQYPFVKQGVPAIYVGVGSKAVDPKVDMAAEMAKWMTTRYHSPSDDLSQPLDYEAALPLIEFNYRLGQAVANADARPRWKPNDFFGKTFGQSR
ncbi:MAG TPA: M28 family metallopeptidase [Thermoanaerobaculia bacterium]|nr:M28 family metallopeptidase [Thermoanaerobaculia bacterium]